MNQPKSRIIDPNDLRAVIVADGIADLAPGNRSPRAVAVTGPVRIVAGIPIYQINRNHPLSAGDIFKPRTAPNRQEALLEMPMN